MAGGGEIDRFLTAGRADPAVAALADGGWVIVWLAAYPEGGTKPIQARFDRDGRAAAAAPLPAGLRGRATHEDTRVAATADGGWVVAWHAGTAGGESLGIECVAFDSEGGCRTEHPVRATSTAAGRLSAPVLTATAGGGFVVTWGVESEDGTTLTIMQRAFDSRGLPFDREQAVHAATVGWQFEVDVTPVADGGWIVVWEAFEGDGAHPGIFLQRFGPAGEPVAAAESVVSPGSQAWQFDPFAVALANGGYLVCWEALDPDHVGLSLYQRCYTAQGAVRPGTEPRVNAMPLGWRFKPVVLALPDGGWDTTWISEARSRTTWGVFQRRFDAFGVAQRLNGHLGAAAADIEQPPLCTVLDDGGLVMTWTTHLVQERRWTIRQRLYDGGSLHRGPAESLVATSRTGWLGRPATLALPGGAWLTVWVERCDDRGGCSLFQRVFAAGEPAGEGRSGGGAAAPEGSTDILPPAAGIVASRPQPGPGPG